MNTETMTREEGLNALDQFAAAGPMPTTQLPAVRDNPELADLEARSISAWFGDHKVLDRAPLPNSNGEWKTVEVVSTRKTVPLRCVITSVEKGAGNTLFVRSATVAAVGPPRR